MRLRHAVATAGITAAAVTLAFGEVANWRASWTRLGRERGAVRSEAVVVLGFRNRGHRANYINRYRVRAGIRSLDRAVEYGALVLCGGPVAGPLAEAELMARYARDELGFAGTIILEPASSSTWQNIQNAIPLIEGADSIKIVSNSVHAEKGRACLWQLRPDLAARLRRGADYRFGELALVKPIAAIIGLRFKPDRRLDQ
jgi:uncharacterized SAM-binding protein YcdF (DUF218 family)